MNDASARSADRPGGVVGKAKHVPRALVGRDHASRVVLHDDRVVERGEHRELRLFA